MLDFSIVKHYVHVTSSQENIYTHTSREGEEWFGYLKLPCQTLWVKEEQGVVGGGLHLK